MSLNLFTWPPFIAALLNLALCVIALSRNSKNPLHQTFAAWNAGMAVWNTTTFLLYTIQDEATALKATHLLRDVFVFIHAFFFHFVLRFIDDKRPINRKLLALAYATSLSMAVANHIGGLFVTGLKRFYFGFYPEAGPLGVFFPLFFYLSVGYAIYLLARAVKGATSYKRNQYQFLLVSAILLFASAFTNFLVVLGVPIYPFGNVMNIAYSLIVAYTVVTFGFMDIRLVIRRSAVYCGLAGALTGVYVLVVDLIKQMFLVHDTLSTTYAYHIAAVPLTLALAPHIRSVVEPFVQRVPLWNKRDHRQAIDELHQKILTLLDLRELASYLVAQTERVFDTEQASLYMRLKGPDLEPCAGTADLSVLSPEHPLTRYLSDTNRIFLRDQILWEANSSDQVPADFLRFAKDTPWVMAVPLIFQNQLLAVLCFRAKQSGEIFNTEDLDLLRTLSRQMAVALSNARALQRVAEQQQQLDHQREMAMMGTLVTEMAHELTKPLTRIINEQTRLEGMPGASQEGLRKIEREARRASEILDGFAMLSPQLPLYRVPTDLGEILAETLVVLGLRDQTAIRVHRHYRRPLMAPVNPGQMLQVFTNIVQNACQAMPSGGDLSLFAEVETTDGASRLRIAVEDTGVGIPAEHLPHVFDPFFTTKQAQGGRGVGLSLSRTMVERHGGTVAIESLSGPRGGTRVVVYLPLDSKEGVHGS